MKPIKILNKLNESTWCGVPGTKHIWNGSWSDPEVEYEGKRYNEWDLQEYIGDAFDEYCNTKGITINSPSQWSEEFSSWLERNPDYAYSAFNDLEPVDSVNESEDFTDTSEYYGGTYPSPPDSYWEEPEHKPSKEEIDDYYADVAHDEAKLNESNILVEKPVYMNTWKNYNEYGADLSQYGIEDGWMTIDDALAFCEKYAEDEPFINDTDGVPIEISDYDNAVEKLNELKQIEEADVDEDVFQAYIEAGNYNNVQDIIDKIESGDYIFFPGVSTDSELAEAYIDMCGGLTEALGEDRLGSYFDEDEYKSEIEDDIREVVRENEGYESIDDVTDEELQSYLDLIVEEEIETAKYDHNDSFFESHFDYEAFGRDLGYDYTFTSTGALCDL